MKLLHRAFLIVILFPLLGYAAPLDKAVMARVDGNTAFACDLYGRLKARDGNLFFSPYSISTALAMTYAGARGNTAQEMAAVLHFEGDAQVHPTFAALDAGLAAVQKKGEVQLAVANSLWPQKDEPFLPAFLDLCKQHYGTTITPLDYVAATESARKTINGWVEDKTSRKITELIKPGILTPLTRLVLANAIYFKGNWARQFDARRTKTEPFHVSASATVPAPLMQQKKKFRYAEYATLQVLELPYAGDDLSMIVLLPSGVGETAGLETNLTPQRISEWLGQSHETEVTVFLPKFKTTSEFSLNQTLAALGMKDAFTGQADFSGMNGQRDLFISAVIHKAFVDVNEEGTEAAAATAVIMTRMMAMIEEKPVVFRADHPFLFLIRENRTGSILFLGRVIDPTK